MISTIIAALAALSLEEVSTALSPDDAREDLQTLYAGLAEAEADLFAQTPRTVFETRFSELRDRYDAPVPIDQLHADLQAFAALARHAHTRIEGLNPGWTAYQAENGPVFPLEMRIEDGEVIVAASAADDIRPGDRILALNGDTNPLWLERITRHVSAETIDLAYAMIAGGDPYFVWLGLGPHHQFDITVERAGETHDLTVPAVALDAWYERETGDAGFSLTGREARTISDTITYLRPGDFYNIEAETAEAVYDPLALAAYTDWVDDIFLDAIETGATDLILDLRDNGGGDVSWSNPVVAWFADRPFNFASDFRIRVSEQTTASNQARLDTYPPGEGGASATMAELFEQAPIGDIVSFRMPDADPRPGPRFEGRVHVLVNRNSFSNAVTTAALIQDYGFGCICGEPTRDMATTYGAMEHFTLPNSGFRVGYPKAHIIRPNGDEEPHPLTPDVILPVPVLRGSEDVTLNALIAHIDAT